MASRTLIGEHIGEAKEPGYDEDCSDEYRNHQ